MRNGTKALSIALAMGVVVIAIAMVGTSAFTSSTIDRDVSIGVESDNTAIIDFMTADSEVAHFVDGKLVIGVDNLNSDAVFTFGDASAAAIQTDYAFAFTNTDDIAHALTIDVDGALSGVSFAAYQSDGSTLTTLGDGDSIASDGIVYVTMEVDTDGWAVDDTVTGTITITLA